ncbi:conjugal transfer protein TraH [Delftia tsuruhatensis]
MFFGSFSFINGAQFEQLLRSIAANATGFAVKAAIKLMCNPCDEILSRLQQAMETLNSMAKNTCAIANSMVSGSIEPKLKEQAARVGTALSGALSLTADWVSGESKRQSQTPRMQQRLVEMHKPEITIRMWEISCGALQMRQWVKALTLSRSS